MLVSVTTHGLAAAFTLLRLRSRLLCHFMMRVWFRRCFDVTGRAFVHHGLDLTCRSHVFVHHAAVTHLQVPELKGTGPKVVR